MKLICQGNRFVCISRYEEKDAVKAAGFRWDKDSRVWYTSDVAMAEKLSKYADDRCREALREGHEALKNQLEQSKAVDAEIDIPAPEGLEYLPFQRAGVAYGLNRPHTLIADEMGLGKTIQAIGLINVMHPAFVLVVCPASLKLNWRNECMKWLVHDYTIEIATGSVPVPKNANLIICNYDIISKHKEITEKLYDILILDECHYLKNPKAQRSRTIYKNIKAGHKIALTGTPIMNRPVEIQPVLSYLGCDFAKDWFRFVTRYCGAYQSRWGWVTDGATHLDELQTKLRETVMVRRLKKDVLTELPPKRRQIIAISNENGLQEQIEKEQRYMTGSDEAVAAIKERIKEAKENADEDGYRSAVEALKEAKQAAFAEITKLRHETALLKVPKAVEEIVNTVEAVGQLVVFAHHRDVIQGIVAGLQEANIDCVAVTGETALEDRQRAVEDFQAGKVNVFVGSIQACGTGITLTAASNEVFVELDWTPSNMNQAEDRCHRIGQHDSVLVQHIVVDGSIDARLAKTLVQKQAIIDQALDNEVALQPIDLTERADEQGEAAYERQLR